MDGDCIRFQGQAFIGRKGERLIFHGNGPDCVPGLVRSFGGHGRYGFAFEAAERVEKL